jgi:hypothetical protein
VVLLRSLSNYFIDFDVLLLGSSTKPLARKLRPNGHSGERICAHKVLCLDFHSTADDLSKGTVLICKLKISGSVVNNRSFRWPLFAAVDNWNMCLVDRFILDLGLTWVLCGLCGRLFPLRLLMKYNYISDYARGKM